MLHQIGEVLSSLKLRIKGSSGSELQHIGVGSGANSSQTGDARSSAIGEMEGSSRVPHELEGVKTLEVLISSAEVMDQNTPPDDEIQFVM